jgi:hypothetical protein
MYSMQLVLTRKIEDWWLRELSSHWRALTRSCWEVVGSNDGANDQEMTLLRTWVEVPRPFKNIAPS